VQPFKIKLVYKTGKTVKNSKTKSAEITGWASKTLSDILSGNTQGYY
jgi:hypothetical protein